VVGRLVEQQHVGLGQQQAAQRDAALFTARQVADDGFPGRQAQRIGGDFELVLDVFGAGRRDDGSSSACSAASLSKSASSAPYSM